MNKCIKVAIKSCNELDNKTLNKTLADIRYLTCKASNKAMQMYYMWELERREFKNTYGEYPVESEKFGKTYRNVVCAEMKKIMNTIYAANVDQTNAFVMKRWNTDKTDILNYRKSVPNFKLSMPINIRNTSFKIYPGNKGFEVDCAIFNKAQEKTHLTFKLDSLDGNKKATLNKIISGTYKQGAAQITQDKKGKWYVIISFGFETENNTLDKNRILGVDLGITNAATLQIWDGNLNEWDRLAWNKCVLDGKELIHLRQKIEARRRDMLRACKVAGNGRTGHGTLTKISPVDTLRDKIENFRDTLNHKYSKYIVDFAIKNNCGVIQLEDLSGFDPDDKFLKQWSYFDLQNKIKYKAEEKGIVFNKVNPQMTSKRCSVCGNISEENRDCKNNQAKFKCVYCDFTENADINAARNISLPNIENIIKDYLKNS